MVPNVVYIVVDSLRADHLGCYGYAKNTSPNLDALAREGVVFDRAFSPGIPTMPSFTTALTGLHPYRHGVTAHASEQRLARDIVLLPQLARAAGYVTIGIDNLAVQASGRGSWFTRGFDYYSGFLYQPFGEQSTQLVDRATNFITDFAAEPFFLFLHLWDPHSPYGPPPPFDTLHYTGEAVAGEPTLAQVKALAPAYYESFLGDMNLRIPDDYGYVMAQYDGEISYADAQIGRMVAHLKALGIWEDTVFVVHSDHGECFGEGGIYFDHHGLYDAVIRVPLVVHTPQPVGGANGSRCNALVSTEDIVPTLAELCGLELPGYPLTGVSFRGALEGRELAGRDEIIAVESTRQASLCLRTDRWKLVQPVTQDIQGASIPDIYGQNRGPGPILFDLENDPTESRDVGALYPAIRDQLVQRLHVWRAEETTRHGSDPLLDGLSLPYDDFMARLSARKLRG